MDIIAILLDLWAWTLGEEDMAGWTLGVIGGSGLYDIAGLEDRRSVRIDSPFGAPSSELFERLMGVDKDYLATRVAYLEAGRLMVELPTDRFFNDSLRPEAAQFLKGELPWS
jgi:hypothetical protein